MNKIKFFGILVIAFLFFMTLIACDNGTTPTNGEELPALTGGISTSFNLEIPIVGDTFTVNTDNLGGIGAINFKWLRDGIQIPGISGSSYTLIAADVNHFIRVEVTRTGYRGTQSFTTRNTVLPIDAPVLNGSISFIGNLIVGQTLTANTNNLQGTGVLFYLWLAWNETKTRGDHIGTGSTVLLTSNHLGKFIELRVGRIGYNGIESITAETVVTSE